MGAVTKAEPDWVVVEEPLEVRLDGEPIATIMRTPGHDGRLALGFLFAEGVSRSMDDVGTVAHCGRIGRGELGHSIDVRSGPGVSLAPPPARAAVAGAGCGVCGRRTIEDLLARVDKIDEAKGQTITKKNLTSMVEGLASKMPIFARTGGAHAAAAHAEDGSAGGLPQRALVHVPRRQWCGPDEPDFIKDRPPSYRPDKSARGVDAIGGDDPFIMQADGKGWLFAPSGLMDGPLPTHYEPEESPVENALYAQQCNPTRREWRRPDNPYHRAFGDPRYPYAITTYRLTEHHTAGGMSRFLSWLTELQPEMFCEVSLELAREKGLQNGGWATISTARGQIECRVLVTRRSRPLILDGRAVHVIGLPYHWGAVGRTRGDAANELLGFVADPNVHIQESKAATADIRPGRRGRRGPSPLPRLPEERDLRDLPGVGPKQPQPERYKKE